MVTPISSRVWAGPMRALMVELDSSHGRWRDVGHLVRDDYGSREELLAHKSSVIEFMVSCLSESSRALYNAKTPYGTPDTDPTKRGRYLIRDRIRKAFDLVVKHAFGKAPPKDKVPDLPVDPDHPLVEGEGAGAGAGAGGGDVVMGAPPAPVPDHLIYAAVHDYVQLLRDNFVVVGVACSNVTVKAALIEGLGEVGQDGTELVHPNADEVGFLCVATTAAEASLYLRLFGGSALGGVVVVPWSLISSIDVESRDYVRKLVADVPAGSEGQVICFVKRVGVEVVDAAI